MIGIGEGVITMLVLSAIFKTRPELLTEGPSHSKEKTTAFVYGTVVVLAMLLLIAPFASRLPDGLERVAQALGFEFKKIDTYGFSTPLSNYRFFGIESPALSTIAAGVAGAVVVFVISYVLARVLIPGTKGANNSYSPKS